MAPAKIRWDHCMQAAHKAFHDDEDAAKRCQSRYWEWYAAQEETISNSTPFGQTCGCKMLSPEQHRVGYQLAKEWLEKARSAEGGRLKLLQIPDAYWPEERPKHQMSVESVRALGDKGEARKNIHAAAINKDREERQKEAELASKAPNAAQSNQGVDPGEDGFTMYHNRKKKKKTL